RLGETRCDRQARDAAGAAEAEHRHAADVAAESETAGDPRLQAWRRDPGRANRHDGIDVGAGELRASQRLFSRVDEQRLGAFEKGFGPLRPAAPLEIPFERFYPVALDDPGVGEDARQG